jgi:uncharacterized protein YabN with tetrapyrrole methylase and pyrophosphatase domain
MKYTALDTPADTRRYTVRNATDHTCCFSSEIVDTTTNGVVCQVYEALTAGEICAALNEWDRTGRRT